MKAYTKPTFMDRVKLAAIWILIGSALMWVISCAPQKQLMENYQREQEYLSYRGKRPANQDMKEEQVLRARDIKIDQLRQLRKKK